MTENHLILSLVLAMLLISCGKQSHGIGSNDNQKINAAITQIMQKDNLKEQKKGYSTLLKFANSGNPEAMNQIAQFHITPSLSGKIIQPSQAEAEKWFIRAAEAGHRPSQVALGFYYRGAHGFENNKQKSCHWLRKADDGENIGIKTALQICP